MLIPSKLRQNYKKVVPLYLEGLRIGLSFSYYSLQTLNWLPFHQGAIDLRNLERDRDEGTHV